MLQKRSIIEYVGNLLSIVFMLLTVSELASGCTNICATTSQQNRIKCEAEAPACIKLRVPFPSGYWYRSSPNNNLTIGTSTIDVVDPNKFKIEFENEGDFSLTILKLDFESYGVDRYLSQQPLPNNPRFSYFSMFIHDVKNTAGEFTFGKQKVPFDSTNAITLDIDTFSDQIEWSYDLESLPLNYLLVNGEKIKTTQCQAQKEWLNCLKTDPIEFNLEKCKSNYQVNLSYGFDGFDEYLNDNQFKPKFVTKTINLQFPPKTVRSTVDVPYYNLNDKVDLKCAVECGNPANYKYTWRDSNNALLFEGASDTYQYDLNAQSVDQKFEVTCTVSNNIVTANLAESQTKFIIAFVETTTGNTRTTNPVTDEPNTTSEQLSSDSTTHHSTTTNIQDTTTQTIESTSPFISNNYLSTEMTLGETASTFSGSSKTTDIDTITTSDSIITGTTGDFTQMTIESSTTSANPDIVTTSYDPNWDKSGNSDLPVWAIVVIAVGSFLIVAVIILIIVAIVVSRRKSSSGGRTSSNRNEQFGRTEGVDNLAQSDTNQEVTPNPVYGNVRLNNLNRQPAPMESNDFVRF